MSLADEDFHGRKSWSPLIHAADEVSLECISSATATSCRQLAIAALHIPVRLDPRIMR
jgi:hypothetical protein